MPQKFNTGLDIKADDLSRLPFGKSDDEQIYNHNGDGEITLVDGSTTTQAGLYIYDHNNSGFTSAGAAVIAFPTDETANRAAGTWYENTSGTTLVVSIKVSGGGGVDISLDVNDTQTANEYAGAVVPDDGTTAVEATTVFATVPQGGFYRLTATAGSVDTWNEHSLI